MSDGIADCSAVDVALAAVLQAVQKSAVSGIFMANTDAGDWRGRPA
jgi:hypothetical protein